MSYKITDQAWIDREVERVKGVLSVHMQKDKTYSAIEIINMLSRYGLEYETPVLVNIANQLITNGFIEEF